MSKHFLDQKDRDAGTIARWKDYRKLQLVCQECGATFTVPPSVVKKGKGKYCSQKCANQAKGRAMSVERHLKQNGYVYIKNWEHPGRSKQNLVAEHRLVVEKAIGRYLIDIEVIHHINGITTDNALFNLFLCKDENEHRIIQKMDKQFLRMLNTARYQHWTDFEKFDIIKDRQDQLQEMVGGLGKGLVNLDLWLASIYDIPVLVDHINEPLWRDFCFERSLFKSYEQLWVAFYMYDNYRKKWDGENWVKE